MEARGKLKSESARNRLKKKPLFRRSLWISKTEGLSARQKITILTSNFQPESLKKSPFFLGKNDFFRTTANCIDSLPSECDNSGSPKSAPLPINRMFR